VYPSAGGWDGSSAKCVVAEVFTGQGIKGLPEIVVKADTAACPSGCLT
jgi:hypothetical protein